LTVLSLFAQFKMHYWWLVTWLDIYRSAGTLKKKRVNKAMPLNQTISLQSACATQCPNFSYFLMGTRTSSLNRTQRFVLVVVIAVTLKGSTSY
jgi:hypothetical protein